MTIEKSHGKARATLPRASDLKPTRTAREPDGNREQGGRFGKGNELAKGRGWKRAIVRMLGRTADDLPEVAASVAADAWRIFTASIREMPHDGPTVRSLVARMARHEALEAYWGARALEALGTPEGDEADKRATLHGQRAERLAVTSLDVARTLAESAPRKPAFPWLGNPRREMRERLAQQQTPAASAVASVDDDLPSLAAGDSTNSDAAAMQCRHTMPAVASGVVLPATPNPTTTDSDEGRSLRALDASTPSSGVSSSSETPNPHGDDDAHEPIARVRVHDGPERVAGPATTRHEPPPQLPEHLAALNRPNPYYVLACRDQAEANWRREQERRWDRLGTPAHQRHYRPMPEGE